MSRVTAPPSSLSSPDHIARLRTSNGDDFETIPELERWARGIPPEEVPEARRLWQTWLGDPARDAALFRLSVQLGGELEPAERYRLLAEAAPLTTDTGYCTVLVASAVSIAVRLGDLDGARR